MSTVIRITDDRGEFLYLERFSDSMGMGINEHDGFVFLTIEDVKRLHRVLGKLIEYQEGINDEQ